MWCNVCQAFFQAPTNPRLHNVVIVICILRFRDMTECWVFCRFSLVQNVNVWFDTLFPGIKLGFRKHQSSSHGDTMAVTFTATSQLQGSILKLLPVCSLACSPRVLWFPSNSQKHAGGWIDYVILCLGANVRVNGCVTHLIQCSQDNIWRRSWRT